MFCKQLHSIIALLYVHYQQWAVDCLLYKYWQEP